MTIRICRHHIMIRYIFENQISITVFVAKTKYQWKYTYCKFACARCEMYIFLFLGLVSVYVKLIEALIASEASENF